MFERLQKKWKVGGLQLALIIATFAIGGSVTGYAGKKIMNVLAIATGLVMDGDLHFTDYYHLAAGCDRYQYSFGTVFFFIKYIRKIGGEWVSPESGVRSPESRNSTLTPSPDFRLPTHIAIFASGAGSNAQKIIDHFKDHFSAKISLIVCNNPQAGVLKIAEKENIPVLIIEKKDLAVAMHI
jgi:hypothetical protein